MRKAALVLLVAAIATCWVSESEAQTDGQIIVHRTSSIGFGNGGYFGGSCGNPWIYGPWTQTLGFIPTPPYYSLYPPVYYSHNVYRPYGMSPFPITSYQQGSSYQASPAANYQRSTPEPKVVVNPYVEQESSQQKAPAEPAVIQPVMKVVDAKGSEVAGSSPLVIQNSL
ncbi:hypothetical protein DTL42_00905 [Bremerella cremea]|uniref:Uncharacterized protein n=1 Tax=Bremerella cremea TaxID=1031537 RepID=A0A368KXB6_9BACT|nr:hypothetical protein [Bremerella cremea]RCS55980.1 hypothetical protein DTL42_00905 [Bremerella cremea]